MIEFLDKQYIGVNEWENLIKMLIQYAIDPNCAVRQAAVYGIGVLA